MGLSMYDVHFLAFVDLERASVWFCGRSLGFVLSANFSQLNRYV
jgi:hypothetical protein